MLYLSCIEEGLILLWVFVSVKSSKNWRLQSILYNEKGSFELRADKVVGGQGGGLGARRLILEASEFH